MAHAADGPTPGSGRACAGMSPSNGPPGNYLTYWITVTNFTPAAVTFEGRYCVLGRN